MTRYRKPHEASGNTEEHSESPTPVEENAIEPALVLAVPRFLFLFLVNSLALAACLLIMTAIVMTAIVVFP